MSPSQRAAAALTFASLASLGYYVHLQTVSVVPLSNRRRHLLTSREYEGAVGNATCQEILAQENVLPRNHPASVTVESIGARLTDNDLVSSYSYPGPWSFKVVSAKSNPNAFSVPSNNVVVYSGLFKFARTEDEVASVLGHEIGHVLARHSGEKMSGGVASGVFAVGAMFIWSSLFGGDGRGAFEATRIGGHLLSELPNSRLMEREADYIGLRIMNDACYDVTKASAFFKRMDREEKGGGRGTVLGWMRTHPVNEERIANIDKWAKEIVGETGGSGRESCERVRREWVEVMRRKRGGGGVK
jgi:predicted Zn-dependent protease